MPSIRASARPNLKGWQPLSNPPPGEAKTRPSEPPYQGEIRSPFMQASMPLMASTSDAFPKQFNSSPATPQTRILPVKQGIGI